MDEVGNAKRRYANNCTGFENPDGVSQDDRGTF